MVAILTIFGSQVFAQNTPPPVPPEPTNSAATAPPATQQAPAAPAKPVEAAPPTAQQAPGPSDDPLVISPGSQFPSDVLGWRSVRWGMSPKEIEARVPEAKPVNKTVWGRKDVVYTNEIDNFMVGDAKFKVHFFALKEKPGLVELELERSTEFSSKAKYNDIQEALLQKYGPPTNKSDVDRQSWSGGSSASKKTDWVFPTTVISLSERRGPGLLAERTIIVITYKANNTKTGVASGL